MNWNLLICCLLGHSFVIAIEANCLRGTGHMWQLKPPTGSTSCNRPSLLPRNATARSAVDTAGDSMGTAVPGVGGTPAARPALVLANYVYECASRRESSSCSKQPEPESKQESESGPEPEVPKPRTVTLAAGALEGPGSDG
ncbi:uncharacterized protein LOC108026115 [Drosophila biarmipes]|uniref:uncharacterized protein LOC108026115 n=1 Tax=Drosophila biarmipes TaxID=125945 RepID=UPI0007E852AB|nr:uncharacterized protein LOC108026115 [Drosophila biarmipes]